MKIEDVFGDLPALETERLLLRKVRREDAEDLFEYASDPEVSRYTTWEPHRSIADSRAFLDNVIAQYEKQQVAGWGVVHRGARKFIGTCGFIYWVPAHDRAEVAYALSRGYWGRGIMTEAVRRVIAFGFHAMQLHRVEARCEVENVASARVMEKVGMTYEGTLRGHMFSKGRYRDLKMYAVLRDEWSG